MKQRHFPFIAVAEDDFRGLVKAEVRLGDYPIYTEWYRETGPDRFDTAISFAVDQVAAALRGLLDPS